jgi:phospholipid N-methyltransferase
LSPDNRVSYQSALYIALKEKHLEIFKFLIRFLPENEFETVGKALCNYFQNFKDEFNILNVIKISKGLNFTKKLLESQFILSESNEETNLLFSSLNFNKNCLNLIDFCLQNFKNDSTTLEKILEFRDQKNQNFIQVIFNSIPKIDSKNGQRIKLLQKILKKLKFMRKIVKVQSLLLGPIRSLDQQMILRRCRSLWKCFPQFLI